MATLISGFLVLWNTLAAFLLIWHAGRAFSGSSLDTATRSMIGIVCIAAVLGEGIGMLVLVGLLMFIPPIGEMMRTFTATDWRMIIAVPLVVPTIMILAAFPWRRLKK
ncbi:MAG: hypothetical protein NUV56_04975 [Candidatus Uhrbacteria bacterium]|nr:hypothetical protein [Candidatus Uhrbacteria bacterium]